MANMYFFRLFPVAIALLLASTALETASAQNAEQAESLLKQLDANGDGVISPGEVPARTQLVLNRIARQAGMEGSSSLHIGQVMQRLRGDDRKADDDDRRDDRDDDDRRRWGRRDDDRDRDRNRDRNEEQPAVPGFGEAVNLVGPPGFGSDAALVLVALEDRYEERVLEYVDKVLDRYDRNKNRMLEPEEIKEGRWSSPPADSDLNKDGILTRAELCERIALRYGGRKENSQHERDSSDSDSPSSASSRSDNSDRYKKYAEALVKQNDKNNNGVLEKEEWENLRIAQGADASNDGVITAAELTAKLSGYSNKEHDSDRTRGSSDRSESSRDRSYSRYSRDRGDRGSEDKPSSSPRFLTATERLPRGLADWFLEADAAGNNDGQVHLSEYEGTPAEFREYDLNNDGFVTPAESLEAVERRSR